MSIDVDPRVAAINADQECTNEYCDAGPEAQKKATAGNWRCVVCGDVYTPGENDGA